MVAIARGAFAQFCFVPQFAPSWKGWVYGHSHLNQHLTELLQCALNEAILEKYPEVQLVKSARICKARANGYWFA